MTNPSIPVFAAAGSPLFCRILSPKIRYFLKILRYIGLFYGRGHGFLWRPDPGSGNRESGAKSGPDWKGKE